MRIVEPMILTRRTAPKLAIVGAGRAGRALGIALRKRGWRIGAVVTRSRAGARAAVRAIGAGEPQAQLGRSVLAADIVLIAVPDGAIAKVARQLAEIGDFALPADSKSGPRQISEHNLERDRMRDNDSRGLTRENDWFGKVVLHVSGALDRTVLRALERRGAATGSLHPLQTFTGRAVPPLAGCICAIEGSRSAMHAARRICRALGCVPVVIGRGAKPAYHAAGSLAAGHVLAVVEMAARILMAEGFSRRKAVQALLPLTRQTLANFERVGPGKSWTGPVSRGDFGTVARHAAALRRFPREYREAYAALSRLSLLLLAKRTASNRRALDRALT
jgi:predicted short-subunit dehydrogenase-like oxidoreductase (DUF2520 family)